MHPQPRSLESADNDATLRSTDVIRFGFLLLPEFPVYALVPAIEALRMANQSSDRRLYSWEFFSVDGEPSRGSNGMVFAVDAAIADVPWYPMVLVFASNHPLRHASKRVLDWLRRIARHGATLCAVDTGQFILAEAGLLDGYHVTVHWEALASFRERYPQIATTEQLFVIDRDRMTCAGGLATLDLMLHLIAHRHAPALAEAVANGFVAQRARRDIEPQRLPVAHRTSVGSHFARVLSLMEANLRTPVSAVALAQRADMSLRALNRLFGANVGMPPMRYYLKLRLQAARNELFYTDMPIQDVADAYGFVSAAHFSRSFTAHFGLSPREFRRRFTAEELRRFRPELEQQLRVQGASGSPRTAWPG